MQSLIDSVREVIGSPNFYVDGVLDYGAVTEYFVCSIILLVVISSIFKFLLNLSK